MSRRAGQVPALARAVRALAHILDDLRYHLQRRRQRGALRGHLRQQVGVQAHAVLQRIHAGGDRRRSPGGVLRVHRDPTAHRVHRLDHGQPGKQPAIPRQLGSGHRAIGPPVAIRVQVDGIAIRKGKSANPENSHQITVTTPATPGEPPPMARPTGA
jgi:hypothetical protein